MELRVIAQGASAAMCGYFLREDGIAGRSEAGVRPMEQKGPAQVCPVPGGFNSPVIAVAALFRNQGDSLTTGFRFVNTTALLDRPYFGGAPELSAEVNAEDEVVVTARIALGVDVPLQPRAVYANYCAFPAEKGIACGSLLLSSSALGVYRGRVDIRALSAALNVTNTSSFLLIAYLEAIESHGGLQRGEPITIYGAACIPTGDCVRRTE